MSIAPTIKQYENTSLAIGVIAAFPTGCFLSILFDQHEQESATHTIAKVIALAGAVLCLIVITRVSDEYKIARTIRKHHMPAPADKEQLVGQLTKRVRWSCKCKGEQLVRQVLDELQIYQNKPIQRKLKNVDALGKWSRKEYEKYRNAGVCQLIASLASVIFVFHNPQPKFVGVMCLVFATVIGYCSLNSIYKWSALQHAESIFKQNQGKTIEIGRLARQIANSTPPFEINNEQFIKDLTHQLEKITA